MKRKLLFVVNVDWFFISHRLPIAIEAIKAGYEVHIITTITNNYNFLIKNGLRVYDISISRSSTRIYSNIVIFFKFLILFTKIKPDLVHLITIKPILIGGLVAKLLNIKSVVLSITGLGYTFLEKNFFSSIKKIIIKKLYYFITSHKNICIIVQNFDDFNFIKNINKSLNKKIILIKGSGVDLKIFKRKKIPKGKPIVMMASRYLLDKGIIEFYEAAKRLKKYGRFVLVGFADMDNPSSIDLKLINTWHKEKSVEDWGKKSNMQNIIPKATIVVLPSYREGFPKVLIEAAACGRAIVTTNVPGCKETIIVGKTGLLAKVKDADSLVNKIKYLLINKDKCHSMGIAARTFAKKTFDINKVITKHLIIYKKLI